MEYFIWILIAVLGLLVYLYPCVVKQTEGFASPQTQTQTPTPSIESLLNDAIVGTPDLNTSAMSLFRPFIEPPTNPAPPIVIPAITNNGPVLSGRLPQEHETIRSTPLSASDIQPPSQVLDQGVSFTEIKPVGIPKCPQPKPKPKPSPICPPQKKCPDLRDYIRKDSIPCWGCKLG